MASAPLDRTWVTRISDLYRRIASVTTLYTFTRPVTAEDVAIVRAELAAAVPECSTWITIEERCVVIDIALNARPIYHRSMIIEPRS